MSLHRHLYAAIFAITLVAGVGISPANAGKNCREHRPSVVEFDAALSMASDIRTRLNKSVSSVALLARVGSDLSRYGLKYTHIGIVRKRASSPEWEVIHQLLPCGSNTSIIRVHGLANFMLDDPFRHDVKVFNLPEPLAQSLTDILDRRLPLQVFEKRYNMISFPGLPALYQNSNQWILEVIAQAQAHRSGVPLHTRTQTHRHYLANGFKGSQIRISSVRRAFSSLGAKNVRFDDHPPESRASGKFEVVSVRAIENYLRTTNDLVGVLELKSDYVRSSQSIGDTNEKETPE